jgi:mono/diheme cytochrome c family protein
MILDKVLSGWFHGPGSGLLLGFSVLALGACQPGGAGGSSEAAGEAVPVKEPPHIVAGSDIEAGRYLVIVGQCNDCHTEGYLQSDGDVPEEGWLAGSELGWRGPWGTTYPPNLRLRVQEWTEDAFVQTLHERRALPPMPWSSVNRMTDGDARAIYRYIRSLGAIGEPMPAAVPPDQEPATPYLSLMPIQPGAQSGMSKGSTH